MKRGRGFFCNLIGVTREYLYADAEEPLESEITGMGTTR